MKNIGIMLILATLSASANADYFFGVNQNGQATPCQSTDWSDAKIKTEFGKTLNCSGATDKEGTLILTCRNSLGNPAAMVYKAKNRSTCDSLHSSITTMLKQ